MSTEAISIAKDDVLSEVAKTTSYAGAKASEVTEYNRVFTTDADETMLDRFWQESCDTATELLRQFITESPVDADTYDPTMAWSSSFDTNLIGSINTALRSFFVNNIVAKWYNFINKAEAKSYEEQAAAQLADARAKVWYRKKPTRTT